MGCWGFFGVLVIDVLTCTLPLFCGIVCIQREQPLKIIYFVLIEASKNVEVVFKVPYFIFRWLHQKPS